MPEFPPEGARAPTGKVMTPRHGGCGAFKWSGAAFCILLFLLSACMERQTRPAPVTRLGATPDSAAGAGAVMVEKGDTLWRISRRYRLPLRDIIDINGLEPPYALARGQRLRLPMPAEHKVGADDTLYRLSRMYQVPVSQLVKVNRLQSPYRLRTGQTLRIPTRAGRRTALQADKNLVVRHAVPAPRQQDRIEAVPLAAPRKAQTGMWAEQAPPAEPAAVFPTTTTIVSSRRPNFAWPLRGKVVSSYGPKDGGLYNDGINIAAPKGAPVAAAADGVVVYVGDDLGSYGNLVLIRHSGGMVTAYAHMSAVRVGKGARVRKGQVIGTVGSTGAVANAQLHFEIRKGAETLDPKKFLG